MANLEIGMTMNSFFSRSSMQELKSLPKAQRQKIANFWREDKDGYISNPVELAILKGFISNSGKVRMPQVDKNLFKERNKYTGEDVYYASEERSDNELLIPSKTADGSISVRFFNSWDVSSDELIDENGDGYADRREMCDRDFINRFGGASATSVDSNLDGHFDKITSPFKDEKMLKQKIDELLSDN